MDDDSARLDSNPDSGAEPELSPREHITRLIDDVQQLASSEIDYYRNRFFYSASIAKWSGLFAIISLASLFGAIVAIILGLLMALASIVGFLVATLIMAMTFLATALFFAWLARRRLRNLSLAEPEGDRP